MWLRLRRRENLKRNSSCAAARHPSLFILSSVLHTSRHNTSPLLQLLTRTRTRAVSRLHNLLLHPLERSPNPLCTHGVHSPTPRWWL
jgi:hypothetical protein